MEDLHQSQGLAWKKLLTGDPEKPRVVWEPSEAIASEQRLLLEEIRFLAINFEHATGGIKRSSILENALRHAGSRYFFQVDIFNAYGHVDFVRLSDKLAQLGFRGEAEDIAPMLEDLCRPPEGEGLAMGGPASQMLFNIYCLDLDAELGKYCAEQGIVYSRYVDDLTFSSPDKDFPTKDAIGRDKRSDLRAIIASHGMPLNERKTRVRDIQEGPIKVTGVQINSKGKLQLPSGYIRSARLRLKELIETASSTQEILNYAAGLNGLLKVVNDPDRRMSQEERALYLGVQDVIFMYGTDLGRYG